MLREPLVELAETSVYQVSFGCRSLRQLRQAQLPRRERSRSLVELAETSVYQVPFGCRSLRLPFPSAAVPFGNFGKLSYRAGNGARCLFYLRERAKGNKSLKSPGAILAPSAA